MIGREGEHEAADVVARTPVHDIEVERRPRRAVNGGRHSADDDELDAGLGESPKQRLEIRDHVAAARPARSSSTNACNCMSVSRRSSTER